MFVYLAYYGYVTNTKQEISLSKEFVLFHFIALTFLLDKKKYAIFFLDIWFIRKLMAFIYFFFTKVLFIPENRARWLVESWKICDVTDPAEKPSLKRHLFTFVERVKKLPPPPKRNEKLVFFCFFPLTRMILSWFDII